MRGRTGLDEPDRWNAVWSRISLPVAGWDRRAELVSSSRQPGELIATVEIPGLLFVSPPGCSKGAKKKPGCLQPGFPNGACVRMRRQIDFYLTSCLVRRMPRRGMSPSMAAPDHRIAGEDIHGIRGTVLFRRAQNRPVASCSLIPAGWIR